MLFTQVVQNEDVGEIMRVEEKQRRREQEREKDGGKEEGRKEWEKDGGRYCKEKEAWRVVSEMRSNRTMKGVILGMLPQQQTVLEDFKTLLTSHGYTQFTPVRVIHCPQSFGIVLKHAQYKVSYSGDTRPSADFRR